MSNDRPKIVLFVDDSPNSREAEQILARADVELVVVRGVGPAIPSAKFDNVVYSGRWGINFLASSLTKREA